MKPATTAVLMASLSFASALRAARSPRTMACRACSMVTEHQSGARGRVGFLGLGIMGEGMAKNLLSSGRSLAVWNRSANKAEAFAQECPGYSVDVLASAADVVEQCDLVYSMLSTPEASTAVYQGPGGVMEGLARRTSSPCVIVDCATLTESHMKALYHEVKTRGGSFLEAPVSGSKGPALAGQLIFLTAGDEDVFQNDEVAADLEAMGKASFFLGEIGAGTRMKLVVNMVMGSMLSTLCEGMDLAEAANLSREQLIDILSLGAMANPMFNLKGPKMIRGDHDPNFPLKHATKDMTFALDLATQLGRDSDSFLPVSTAATARFEKAMKLGLGDQDFSAIIEARNDGK